MLQEMNRIGPDSRISGKEGQRCKYDGGKPLQPGYSWALPSRNVPPNGKEIIQGEKHHARNSEDSGIFAICCETNQKCQNKIQPGASNSMPEQEIGDRNQHGHRHIEISQSAEIDQPGTDRQAKSCKVRDSTSKRSTSQCVDNDDEKCSCNNARKTSREKFTKWMTK